MKLPTITSFFKDFEVIYPEYSPQEFFQAVNLKENKAQRCAICWNLRLRKTAQTAKEKGCDFVFIVGFDEVLAFSRIYQSRFGDVIPDLEKGIGGRTDRNDEKDVEEVYLIPTNLFYKLPY